jgi:hypothetical protein
MGGGESSFRDGAGRGVRGMNGETGNRRGATGVDWHDHRGAGPMEDHEDGEN